MCPLTNTNCSCFCACTEVHYKRSESGACVQYDTNQTTIQNVCHKEHAKSNGLHLWTMRGVSKKFRTMLHIRILSGMITWATLYSRKFNGCLQNEGMGICPCKWEYCVLCFAHIHSHQRIYFGFGHTQWMYAKHIHLSRTHSRAIIVRTSVTRCFGFTQNHGHCILLGICNNQN